MGELPDIRLSNGSSEENDRLIERYIRQRAVPGIPLHILEAGCGQYWPLNLDGIQSVLWGLDVDRKALEMRKYERGDLDEIIEGDLRSVELGDKTFDVIYCSFVLEHIREADVVLKNFARWLKQDGLLVVRIPDPRSVRGFVTRITPHWFHLLYYKHVLRRENAGKAGYGPYVTFFHPVVSREGIHGFCARFNLTVEEEHGEEQPDGEGMTGLVVKTIARTVAGLSAGKLTARHANLLYILQKAPVSGGVVGAPPAAVLSTEGAASPPAVRPARTS